MKYYGLTKRLFKLMIDTTKPVQQSQAHFYKHDFLHEYMENNTQS